MSMNDGHSGIENRQVNEGGSGQFRLVLSYLVQVRGAGSEMVIHVSCNTLYAESTNFLISIGLAKFYGRCPFHGDRCFYRVLARLTDDEYGIPDDDQIQSIHQAFAGFAAKIDSIFQLRRQEADALGTIGIRGIAREIFRQSPESEIDKSAPPRWVNDAKFPQLTDLESKESAISHEIDELATFLVLIYGTGDELVRSVVAALRFLGLRAEETEPGFTADILAQTSDGRLRFGFEVTGIAGAIKKDSKKLTQVLEFERVKENDEKTVLLANTHNDTPLPERAGREDFTVQVTNFLSRHPIVLMTGLDLYRMVGDVLSGAREKEAIIELLHAANGRLVF